MLTYVTNSQYGGWGKLGDIGATSPFVTCKHSASWAHAPLLYDASRRGVRSTADSQATIESYQLQVSADMGLIYLHMQSEGFEVQGTACTIEFAQSMHLRAQTVCYNTRQGQAPKKSLCLCP